MVIFQIGMIGHNVIRTVLLVCGIERETVVVLRHCTEENAMGLIFKRNIAIISHALVSLPVCINTCLRLDSSIHPLIYSIIYLFKVGICIVLKE